MSLHSKMLLLFPWKLGLEEYISPFCVAVTKYLGLVLSYKESGLFGS
jgi:hypothetical protein